MFSVDTRWESFPPAQARRIKTPTNGFLIVKRERTMTATPWIVHSREEGGDFFIEVLLITIPSVFGVRK